MPTLQVPTGRNPIIDTMHAEQKAPTTLIRPLWRRLLDALTSMWASVLLLSLIVVYAAVGSAVPPFRQYFELTEAAYFSHWVFGLLIGLLSLTVVAATMWRIRFNWVNAGAIIVHTGILLLAGGSMLYFGEKIEGDVKLEAPRVAVFSKARSQRGNAEEAQLGAMPAVKGRTWQTNMPMAGGNYAAEVISVKHEGMATAALVEVKVTSGDPPQTRTVTLGRGEGRTSVVDFDANVVLALSPATTAEKFYDNDVMVLNVRAAGATTSFPLAGLPMYAERLKPGGPEVYDENGRKVAGARHQRLPLLDHWRLPIPLNTSELVDTKDWPVRMEVDGYLPYAELRREPIAGGTEFNPVAMAEMLSGGSSQRVALFGKLPAYSFDGTPGRATCEFRWLDEKAESRKPNAESEDVADMRLAEWTAPVAGKHVLDVEVKDAGVKRQYEIRTGQEIAVEGTAYKLKVDQLMPTWPLMTPGLEGARSPVAQVSVSGNGKKFQRTVIQRYPALSQDVDETGKRHRDAPYDANLVLKYTDCSGHHFLIAAGKDMSPVVVHTAPGGKRQVHKLEIGKDLSVGDGVGLRLASLIERPQLEARPSVIESVHRQRNAGRQMSLVRVRIESTTQPDWKRWVWVPFTLYGDFEDKRPMPVEVPGLGTVELVYGRKERKLPAPITLEQLHVNFTTGRNTARDWHSFIRFEDPRTGEVKSAEVYTNHTARVGEWTLYQATAATDHVSWTGLGVGNRQGIMPMTLGCILITGGLLYAFYTKPVVKRRLKEKFAMQANSGLARPGGAAAMMVALLSLAMPSRAFAQADDPHAGMNMDAVHSHAHAPPADLMQGAKAFASLKEMEPKLKLDAFRLLVVQHAGRYQTVEAWARDVVKTIHGSDRMEGVDPVTAALEIMFNRRAHDDQNLIRVKELGLRCDISAHPVQVSDAEAKRIRTTGMVSFNYLRGNHDVENVLAEMETKVTMQRAMNRVNDALFFYERAADTLAIVPNTSGNAVSRWHTMEDIVGNAQLPTMAGRNLSTVPGISPEAARKVLMAYFTMGQAWQARDADAVGAQAAILADELPKLAPAGLYLSESQRKAEAFYTRMNAFTWGWGVYIFALAVSIWAVVTGWRAARGMAMSIFVIALLLHGFGIGLRWYILGRIPVANMFEAVVSSAWVGALLALGLELRLIRAWQVIYLVPMCFSVVLQQRYDGTPLHTWWIVLAVIAGVGLLGDMVFVGLRRRGAVDSRIRPGFYILAANFLGAMSLALGRYAVGSELTTIMSILDDVLLRIHTVLIIVSYAIVTLAFCVAMCYLVVRAVKHGSGVARVTLGSQIGGITLISFALADAFGPSTDAGMISLMFVLSACVGGALAWALPYMLPGRAMLTGGPAAALMSGGRTPARTHAVDTPLLAGLDLSQMTLMNMANIGLFAGMILGAVWADYSWGRPWGWDPKEVFALNTWLIYAILIHVRFLTRDKGLWSAVVACIGFAMMMFNWWAVNFYIVGLHSYA